jgi:hypothetical protein
MLGCPGLSHQLPKRIISCSQDESSIGGPSVGSLARLIFDRPGAFDNAYICTLLRSSLNLFPDKAQGCHCLNMPLSVSFEVTASTLPRARGWQVQWRSLSASGCELPKNGPWGRECN